MSAKYDKQAEKETIRLEAFSDGVYAIAITLLVLELKVPHDLHSETLSSTGESPSALHDASQKRQQVADA